MKKILLISISLIAVLSAAFFVIGNNSDELLRANEEALAYETHMCMFVDYSYCDYVISVEMAVDENDNVYMIRHIERHLDFIKVE